MKKILLLLLFMSIPVIGYTKEIVPVEGVVVFILLMARKCIIALHLLVNW